MYSEKNLADRRVKDFYWLALFWGTAAALDLIVGFWGKESRSMNFLFNEGPPKRLFQIMFREEKSVGWI